MAGARVATPILALMLSIPPAVAETIVGIHKDAGREWLATAPGRIAALAREQGFRLHPPFEGLSQAYVAPVTLADGRAAVLKAQPPHDEASSELAALAAWNGAGAVRLLWSDPKGAFALLEHVRPGITLETVPEDDEATQLAAGVMRRLCVAPPSEPALIPLAHWGGAFGRYRARYPSSGPLPVGLVSAAEAAWDKMLASSPEPRLLHGDLHHGNILAADGEWLAIDPKGVVGDPAFEPSALFFNPHDRLAACGDVPALVARRLHLLSDALALDRGRIAAWAFARCVLSMCWTIEDNASLRPWMLDVSGALYGLATR